MDIAIIITFICFIPFLGDGKSHTSDTPPFALMVLGYGVMGFLFFCFMGGGTMLKEILGA